MESIKNAKFETQCTFKRNKLKSNSMTDETNSKLIPRTIFQLKQRQKHLKTPLSLFKHKDATCDEKFAELNLPTGTITELSGESGTGKSNFALELCWCVQLPVPLGGLNGAAIYITCGDSAGALSRLYPRRNSSEDKLHGIGTRYIRYFHERIKQQCSNQTTTECTPSLDEIWLHPSIHDLQVQDHVLRYQLPEMIRRSHLPSSGKKPIKLIVIDGIGSNLRYGHSDADDEDPVGLLNNRSNSSVDVANKMPAKPNSSHKLLAEWIYCLKQLAYDYDIVVICINEVCTVMSTDDTPLGRLKPSNGCYKTELYNTSKPQLGIGWSNLINCRLWFSKKPNSMQTIERAIRCDFSSWLSSDINCHSKEHWKFDILDEGICPSN